MASTREILLEVFDNPEPYISELRLDSGERILFRPLMAKDVGVLTKFLQGLSEETRRFSTFESYDKKMATKLCDAINRYDKLRFVLVNVRSQIAGLIEFSFGIPAGDIKRYEGYKNKLNKDTDCRWGITLADKYQNKSIGTLIFPTIVKLVTQFDKRRIILYGGVLADNYRAIHYYSKLGFRSVGAFTNKESEKTIDMIFDVC